MPVVVTAAETPLGQLVVRRLLADGAEVRAVADKAVDLGVPTAFGAWHDGERLGAVLEGAHTVVHLAAASRLPDVLDAAEGSGVRRIVVLGKAAKDLRGAEGYEVVAVPDTRRRFRTPPAVLEALAEALVEADRRR